MTLLPGRGGYIVEAVGLMLEHKSGLRIWHTADVNTVAILTTDAAYLPPGADTVMAARGKLFSSCSARSVTSTVPGIASGSA